jgi:hypothetical protein
MTETYDDVTHEEPAGQDGEEGGEAPEGEGVQKVEAGTGGYQGRDPKTEMPRVPGQPETQDQDE